MIIGLQAIEIPSLGQASGMPGSTVLSFGEPLIDNISELPAQHIYQADPDPRRFVNLKTEG